MSLVEPGRKTDEIPNYLVQFLINHCAFMRASQGLDFQLPEGHDTTGDLVLETLPFLVDRNNNESVERKSLEAMEELSSLISSTCAQIIIDHCASEEVAASEVEEWVEKTSGHIRRTMRTHCGIDCFNDVEIGDFLPGKASISGIWQLANESAYDRTIERHQSLSSGIYAIVGPQHILALHSHMLLELVSKVDPNFGESWTFVARFRYEPTISSSFTHVKAAKVLMPKNNDER